MNQEASDQKDGEAERPRRWAPSESLTTPYVSQKRLLVPLAITATKAKTEEAREVAQQRLQRFQRKLGKYMQPDAVRLDIAKLTNDLEWQRDRANSGPRANILTADLEFVKRMREKIDGRRDKMTGLFNRHGVLEALQEFMQHPDRFIHSGENNVTGKPIGIILLDLDGLKWVNDNHGHNKGDEVIVAFGRVMRERLRDTDIAARFGGDEFWGVLPGIAQGEARMANGRIATAMEEISVNGKDGRPLAVKFSTGSAVFQWDDLYKVLEQRSEHKNEKPLREEVIAKLSGRLAASKQKEGKGYYTGGETGTLPVLQEEGKK